MDNQVVHVIDDDLDVRQSLAFLLSTAGLAVRVYETALAFLATARSWPETAAHPAVTLYDPVPMRMARLANLERGQLLVECASRPALQAFLTAWQPALEGIKSPSRLRWHLEVDPLEF